MLVFDKDKIKDSMGDIQKKILRYVLIFLGIEVGVTLFVGLPLSAAMFHTERIKDGLSIGDFFVFSLNNVPHECCSFQKIFLIL